MHIREFIDIMPTFVFIFLVIQNEKDLKLIKYMITKSTSVYVCTDVYFYVHISYSFQPVCYAAPYGEFP